MKKQITYILGVAIGFGLIVLGCSTQKNTGFNRQYHAFVTQYNIKFNGKESYNEGIQAIQKANTDDYTTLLSMYPISNPANAKTAESQMNKTIEKSRKSMKLHSIKKKPKRNDRRWNNPKYRLFYEQNEFNSALKEAWLLLAKAEFHKGDFLGSVGTFSYISRYYVSDKDVVAQCQLWRAKAFMEMGWDYEAEQIIAAVNQDHLKYKNSALYASTNAQLLLKLKQYARAIPFLETALQKEKDRYQKQRFTFILGQIYKMQGNRAKADAYFEKVSRMNPPYEMDFYARINRVELSNDYAKVHKNIRRMMKNSNNKEYLDQLFLADGNVYMLQKDTVKALIQYTLAADTSTRNGLDKAIALIKAADIFYIQRKYVEAQPRYDEASKILSNEHADYKRITNLTEVLSELVTQHEIVTLQDSLLHLADLPREEQLKIAEKMIADKKAATFADSLRAARREREQQNVDSRPVMTNQNIGNYATNWYFYNQNLIRTGKTDFSKKWGNRKLEDNWRRTNKAVAFFAENTDIQQNDSISNDNANISPKAEITDTETPEFYLQQIPATPEAKALVNKQIADAMFSMGIIYKDKINDFLMAMQTFDEFERRFATDTKVPDAYFQQFVMMTKDSVPDKAENYRQKILTEFPDTKYAKMLANPNFVEQQKRMLVEQDSIYALTYCAYSASDFHIVYQNTNYIKTNFPQSELLPKFKFLNALSIGKTAPRDTFALYLNDLLTTFPESDVSAMAKDILALINQGRENVAGTSHGSLIALRQETLQADKDSVLTGSKGFSAEKLGKHRLLLIATATQQEINELMYQVASYNFSRFMIKDFDLIITVLDSVHTILSVTNLDSFDETKWYEKSLWEDVTLKNLFEKLKIESLAISEDNFALLLAGRSFDEYLALEKTLEIAKTPDKAKNEKPKTQEKVEIKVVEIPKEKSAEIATDSTQIAENQVENKTVETPKENVEMYKNTFAIEPAAPHYIALFASQGKIDFDKVKTNFDKYNAENYSVMNLQIALETVANKEVVLVGSFQNADLAKSYLLRMVKEKMLFDGMKGTNHRNLIGTQRNLNTMMNENAVNLYMEFMKEFYLK